MKPNKKDDLEKIIKELESQLVYLKKRKIIVSKQPVKEKAKTWTN